MPRAPKLCIRCNSIATSGAFCDSPACRPAPFAGARERWAAQRPGNWATLRRKTIKRYAGRCAERGCIAKGTQVDHIHPVSEGGDWSLDNLQLLCEDHHKLKIKEEARRGRRRAA